MAKKSRKKKKERETLEESAIYKIDISSRLSNTKPHNPAILSL